MCNRYFHRLWVAYRFTICETRAMSDTHPYLAIGQRLEAIRRGFSELNQRDWAEHHAFGATTYNNWVKGIRRIPVECAEVLADAYGLDLDFVYRGKLDGLSEKARKVLSSQ